VTDRIESLDSLKAICIFLVVLIHSSRNISSEGLILVIDFIVMNTTRVAIPLFFLTSGYLVSKKVQSRGEEYLLHYCRSLIRYYIAGSGLYLIANFAALQINRALDMDIISSTVQMASVGPEALIRFLYYGDAVALHLWFLPALLISVSLSVFATRRARLRSLWMISVLAFVVGVLSNAYGIGPLLPRGDAIFLGTAFVSSGFLLEKIDMQSLDLKNVYLVLATGVFFLERLLIEGIGSGEPYWGVFSFGTYPLSVLVFIYFIKHRESIPETVLNRYGKNTVWTYILHPVMLGIIVGVTSFAGFSDLAKTVPFGFTSAIITFVTLMEADSRNALKSLKGKTF
jgi:surface polysaccharide O-acyltransferase-like enzyme